MAIKYDRKRMGNYIKSRRALCEDMSREELAERSGLSLASITAYENGATSPVLESAVKLADALGCTVNDLCGWEERP